jgi:hypothetical protein
MYSHCMSRKIFLIFLILTLFNVIKRGSPFSSQEIFVRQLHWSVWVLWSAELLRLEGSCGNRFYCYVTVKIDKIWKAFVQGGNRITVSWILGGIQWIFILSTMLCFSILPVDGLLANTQQYDFTYFIPDDASDKAFLQWSTRPDTSDTRQRPCTLVALTHLGRILPVFHIVCRFFRLWHLHNWPCIWWQRRFPVTPIFLLCFSLLPNQKMFLISNIVIIMSLSASPDTRLLCAT